MVRYLKITGVEMTLDQLVKSPLNQHKLNKRLLVARLRHNWSITDALKHPKCTCRKTKQLDMQVNLLMSTMNRRELAKTLNVSIFRIKQSLKRIKAGKKYER